MTEDNHFYTKEDLEAGTHPGWIVNPTIAESVAYVEKDEGKDAALALEKSLVEKEKEKEKENNDFVDLLLEQCPYVFTEVIDPKTEERYIATSWSIFRNNIMTTYRSSPFFDPFIVLSRFQEQLQKQLKDDGQEGRPMRNFYNDDYLTLFSKHGFLTARGRLYENLPNYPKFNYNPEDIGWRNIRDMDETCFDFEGLFKSLALYQRIGEEFEKEIDRRIDEELEREIGKFVGKFEK